MQITSWPAHQCKIADDNFNQIFDLSESSHKDSTFLKPLIARKNNDFAEILIGDIPTINYAQLPIYFIPEDYSQFQILQYITDYFLFDGELNNRIISNILNYIDKIESNEKDQKRYISTKLKISPRPKIVETYKKFSLIKNSITDFLIQKKAPLKVWEYLAKFSQEEQNFFFQLLTVTKPSMSNFLEIVENFSELQIIKAFDLLELDTILNDDIDKKLSRIREVVNRKRYPNLISHREEIVTLFDKIANPNNLNLQYDQSFEKKEIRGFFNISKIDDIESLKKFFSEKNINILKETLEKL